eukprot:3703349-Rhodomonas_salina.1
MGNVINSQIDAKANPEIEAKIPSSVYIPGCINWVCSIAGLIMVLTAEVDAVLIGGIALLSVGGVIFVVATVTVCATDRKIAAIVATKVEEAVRGKGFDKSVLGIQVVSEDRIIERVTELINAKISSIVCWTCGPQLLALALVVLAIVGG